MAHRTVLFGSGVVAVMIVSSIFVGRANSRSGNASTVAPVARTVTAAPKTPWHRAVATMTHASPAPLHAARVPAAARDVAIRYALDVFRSTIGQATYSWIHAVAGLCTRSWLAHIERANSAQQLAPTSSLPLLTNVFASWAPSHAVAVTVVVAINKTVASLYVELRSVHHHYLVAAAQ